MTFEDSLLYYLLVACCALHIIEKVGDMILGALEGKRIISLTKK